MAVRYTCDVCDREVQRVKHDKPGNLAPFVTVRFQLGMTSILSYEHLCHECAPKLAEALPEKDRDAWRTAVRDAIEKGRREVAS